MILALTHSSGEIDPHFGHTKEFKLYEIIDGKVLQSRVIPVNEGGHAGIVLCLMTNRVGAVICGSIGADMHSLLTDVNIPVFAGAEGDCDECVALFLRGELVYSAPTVCDCDHTNCASCGHGCHDADFKNPLEDCNL